MTWNRVSNGGVRRRRREREERDGPRSRRSPRMVTRSAGLRRSGESMRQQRSMSGGGERGWDRKTKTIPELRREKPLAVEPKARRRQLGWMLRMRRWRRRRTFSFTWSSSGGGRSWMTKSKRHWERSALKRGLRGDAMRQETRRLAQTSPNTPMAFFARPQSTAVRISQPTDDPEPRRGG